MTRVGQELRLARGATVVLSGCETLRGQERPEGTLGVARAFMLAGAGRVVASLWKVNDAHTEALMVDFYSKLYEGQDVTVAQAMQGAMVASIKSKDKSRRCPSKWAAFLVYGA